MSNVKLERGRGSLPLYLQICEALKRDIQIYYQAGDALPSEFELSESYNVNRHTLRRAVDELVRDGIVLRHHGKGMFVQAPSIEYPIASRTRLTETLEAQGVMPTSRVIKKQLLIAKGGVARALMLEEGAPIVFLETLREMEDKPFCVCSHFLPYDVFPGLYEEYQSGSLHAFIEQKYHEQLKRTQSMISAVIPELEDVERLKIPLHLPVLRAKSTNVSKTSGKPLEYVVTRFRGDLAQIVVHPE